MTALEPQFLEAPVSTSAQELRSAFAPLQAGVMDAGDLKVTTAGGVREVSVAAGVGFVRGSNITDQGLYRVRSDAAISSLTFELGAITANGTAFPRIDQIIARVLDQTHDGSGLRKWRPEVVTGVATTGATLDNRTGAIADGSIGNNWMRLADVLVPAGAVTILAANIRDRRPWARGAFWFTNRSAGNMTTASTTPVELDTTLLKPRIECSGVPIEITISGSGTLNATTGAYLDLFMDGVLVTGGSRLITEPSTASKAANITATWTLIPAAGSHSFSPAYSASTGTATVFSNAGGNFLLLTKEMFRANANNS